MTLSIVSAIICHEVCKSLERIHARGTMMDSEILFLVEESPEGGFQAKALGHAIYTEAETYSELRKMVKEAVRCHFETADCPRVIRLHQVTDDVMAV